MVSRTHARTHTLAVLFKRGLVEKDEGSCKSHCSKGYGVEPLHGETDTNMHRKKRGYNKRTEREREGGREGGKVQQPHLIAVLPILISPVNCLKKSPPTHPFPSN